jgi:hypothetical protein
MKAFHNVSSRFFAAAGFALVCFGAAVPASAVTIYDNTGTGVYTITSDTIGETSGLPTPAVVVPAPYANNWVTNPAASWVAPNSNQSNATRTGYLFEGVDTYQTTFDTTGMNLATTGLSMTLTADDSVIITLNGNTIFSGAPNMWSGLSSFTDGNSSNFVSGVNTLIFTVTNDESGGPTGLNAAVTITDGSGSATPEPATFVPLSLALIGGAMVLQRRKRSSGGAR